MLVIEKEIVPEVLIGNLLLKKIIMEKTMQQLEKDYLMLEVIKELWKYDLEIAYDYLKEFNKLHNS